MSARYQNPMTSRWMSADPAGAGLVNPMDDEGNLRGSFNLMESVNWFSYVGNNPISYIDPTGKWVALAGITLTSGMGTGVTGEMGIAVSRSNDGNWEVGTYQTSGGGLYGGYGGSGSLSITFAPLAQKIDDVSGAAEALGGSTSVAGPVSAGGDLNVPIGAPLKNFSLTGNGGLAAGSPEGHMMTTMTTTQVKGAGESFGEAWKNAVDSGMFEGMPEKAVELFKDHFKQSYTPNPTQDLPTPVTEME